MNKIGNAVKLVISLLGNLMNKKKIAFIATPIWSVAIDHFYLCKELNRQKLISARKTLNTRFLRSPIVHFGPLNRNEMLKFLNNRKKEVHYGLTWYHILDDDDRVELLPQLAEALEFIHTSCQITKEKLIKNGVPNDKVVVIPLGVDLGKFKVVSRERKDKIRKKLGLPTDKLIIGSFQKDEEGWRGPMNPKSVKGPDVFCDALEELVKQIPDIHVLLTGPSRKYVKHRLEKIKIPYTHHYLKSYFKLPAYYQALDLYLITSREEGGPKALLESWATGVPVISTKVGMSLDCVTHGKDGYLTEIEDSESIAQYAIELLKNSEKSEQFKRNGVKTVKRYDWAKIAAQHYEQLYAPLF